MDKLPELDYVTWTYNNPTPVYGRANKGVLDFTLMKPEDRLVILREAADLVIDARKLGAKEFFLEHAIAMMMQRLTVPG